MIVLLEPLPHFAGLDSNYRVVSGGVISRTVEQIGSNATLLQQFVMPVEAVLDEEGEKRCLLRLLFRKEGLARMFSSSLRISDLSTSTIGGRPLGRMYSPLTGMVRPSIHLFATAWSITLDLRLSSKKLSEPL